MIQFWQIFIIIVCVAFSVFFLGLLFKTSKIEENDEKVTGHKWDDDLEELNMPLPRWWLYTFILSIIWGVGYAIYYPTFGQTHKGIGNWTAEKEYSKEVAQVNDNYKEYYQSIAKGTIKDIANNEMAKSTGRRLFLQFCAGCHASDAGGSAGYPNLIDKDWLYGGDTNNILASIKNGRNGVMPEQKTILNSIAAQNGIDKSKAVDAVVDYVISLSGLQGANKTSSAGKKLFDSSCAACHKQDGTGMTALGAPNLADKVWLYNKGAPDDIKTIRKSIVDTINNGKVGTMPAHKNKMSNE